MNGYDIHGSRERDPVIVPATEVRIFQKPEWSVYLYPDVLYFVSANEGRRFRIPREESRYRLRFSASGRDILVRLPRAILYRYRFRLERDDLARIREWISADMPGAL